FIEEQKLIESLQNRINCLSDEIEDAKDALFSEVNYQTFSNECEMIAKMQTQIKVGKNKCKQLCKRIKDYKIVQATMQKELDEMNLRIEKNERYKKQLIRRMEKAKMIAWYRKNQIIKQQSITNAILKPKILTSPMSTTL
ncbi:unnamed protein product, partial [Onchocerca ochengi]